MVTTSATGTGSPKPPPKATEGVYKSVAMQLDFSEVYAETLQAADAEEREDMSTRIERREEDASAYPRLLLRDVDVDVLRAADEAGAD